MRPISFFLATLILFNAESALAFRELGEGQTRVGNSSPGVGFRDHRKLGLGVALAGLQGILGASLELNFSPSDALAANFGLGQGFQSLGIKYKRIMAGDRFSPYFCGHFSRWYTVGGDRSPMSESSPGFLAEKFLSPEERLSGEFSETLFAPGFGFQYSQLDGEWAGMALYAEVLMVVDIEDLLAAPTGEIGFMRFF